MRVRSIVAALVFGVLAGCANLAEVRDYAGQSANLTAYTGVVKQWGTLGERKEPYVLTKAEADRNAALARDVKAGTEARLKIHAVLSEYFKTLASLAGDDAFSLDPNIEKLAGSLSAVPSARVTEEQVTALRRIASLVTNAWQQRELRATIERANDDVQLLLRGMEEILDLYNTALASFYDDTDIKLRAAIADAEKQKLMAGYMWAKQQRANFAAERAATQNQITQLRAACAKMREGHQALYDHRNQLTASEAVKQIREVSDTLRAIRAAL